MIEEDDKAKRLAQAICADVMLYNAAVKDAPVDQRRALISGPVQEGRELFASRVSPRLAYLFEEALAELVARPLGIEAPGVVARSVVSPAARPSQLDPPAPESGSSKKLVLVVAVLLVIAAVVVFTIAAK